MTLLNQQRRTPKLQSRHADPAHLFDWTAAATSVHRRDRQWQLRLPQRQCRVVTVASSATGRKTTSGAQRSAEQSKKRMADYYARLTLAQEERQNAEARESFLEQQQRLTVNRPIKS
jgi:hypothetical protein